MKKNYLVKFCIIMMVVVSSCGSDSNSGDNSAPTKTVVVSGKDVYNRTCVACHQPNGQGLPGSFPPLAKSDYISNKENTIRQVLKGSSGEITVNGNKYNNTMPAQMLSDDEIAAVLTYVYGNFGNNGGTVTPDEVKQERGKQ